MPIPPTNHRQLSQPRRIVLLMGRTGAGKSTFIETVTCQNSQVANLGLISYTEKIRVIEVEHPNGGQPVVFVDTPGFDNSLKSDEDIQAMIDDWLTKDYNRDVDFATILYLHPISDNRMAGSSMKNLQLLSRLSKIIPNVIIATTMWDDVKAETGVRREQELTEFYKDMLQPGCKPERFDNTYTSAWSIVDSTDRPGTQAESLRVVYRLRGPEDPKATTISQDVKQVPPEDRIVLVMGRTGTGKSTFINFATGQNTRTVGHGWNSYTTDIQSVRAIHPIDGHPVVFVDTPGLDHTDKPDSEILAMIAEWLVRTYKGKANLAAILYLHKISDNRISGSAMKHLRLFSSLCGQIAMPNVIIVTTMWSKICGEDGNKWEEVLKREVWKDMLSDGCEVERFEDTNKSAWRIIDSLAEKDRARVLLSSEIVDTRLRLNKTQAGVVLNQELERLINARKVAVRKLRHHAENQDTNWAEQELKEIEIKIHQTVDQLRLLTIPITWTLRLLSNAIRS